MKDELDELKKLIDAISEAERDLAHSEGQLDVLYKRLETESGEKTSDAAYKKISDINRQLLGIRSEISEGIKKLKELYEW